MIESNSGYAFFDATLTGLAGVVVGFALLVAKKGDKFGYVLMEKWFD